MSRQNIAALCLGAFVVTVGPVVADETEGADDDFERATCKDLLCEEFATHVRGIIAEIVDEAKTSNQKGEQRCEALIQAGAAYAADEVPEEHRARAFLLALAVAMDSGDEMRRSALTEKYWKMYESDEERSARLANLGHLTMHGRQDAVRHFFIAAGLTAIMSPQVAEALSILKEVSDANGGSGFSWVDLGADLAGIVYAKSLIANRVLDDPFARNFEVATFVPTAILELPEGIMLEELQSQFSLNSKSRFQREVRRIEALILELPIYKEHSDGLTKSATR